MGFSKKNRLRTIPRKGLDFCPEGNCVPPFVVKNETLEERRVLEQFPIDGGDFDFSTENDALTDSIDYRKRVKIDPTALRQIRRMLKENGHGNLAKLKRYSGIELTSVIHHEITVPIEGFKKLKLFIKNTLGSEALFNTFGADEIPHEIYIGRKNEIKLGDNHDLSELFSIFNGDGYISDSNFDVQITLNEVDEEDYIVHVENLLDQFFPGAFHKYDTAGKAIRFISNSPNVHHFLVSKGLIPGDKVQNQISVHPLAFRNKEFAKSALKGLFDTDGAILLEKAGRKISLKFGSSSKPLVEDFQRLCDYIGVKTGQVNGPYYPESGEPQYTVRIAAKSEIDKFIKLVDPHKFKEKNRRIHYGTSLIIADLPPNSLLKEEIESQILADYPQSSDRQYSKEFALYLKELSQRLFIRHGLKNIYGIPFRGVITDQMTDIALQQAVKEREVVFTRDGSRVHYMEWRLKYEICELIVKILKDSNYPLNLLSHSDIFSFLEKKLYNLNNYELISIFSCPDKRMLLSEYLKKRIEFVKALYGESQIGRSLSWSQANNIYNIENKEYYSIIRFLKRKFPNEFDV